MTKAEKLNRVVSLLVSAAFIILITCGIGIGYIQRFIVWNASQLQMLPAGEGALRVLLMVCAIGLIVALPTMIVRSYMKDKGTF